jgi:DNA polymerase-3 subunit epsilon
MREIVLDTETTGLNFRAGDRITEVGCTELVNHVATNKDLQFYCSVDKKVSEDAVRISGLTNEFLSKHNPFKDNVDSFLDFIKGDTLIIHNADFDMGFINNELSILGRPPLKNKIIDTLSLARKTLNTRVANLDYLCRRFSIDLSERNLHGALLDTQLLAEVYLELIGGKQISMNLDLSENKKNILEKNINKSKLIFSKIKLSEEEVLLHKSHVRQIKNPLWEKINY